MHLPVAIKVLAVTTMFAAPAGYYIVDVTAGDDDALRGRLYEMGFVPLKMPSTGVHLGSIYAVETSGDLQPVCEADRTRIDQIAVPYHGLDTEASYLSEGHLSLSFSTHQLLSDRAKSNYKTTVNFKMRDITVREIPLDQDSVIQTELLNSNEGCDLTTRRLLRLGKYVCQVQKVIEANAEITIDSQKDAANRAQSGANEARPQSAESVSPSPDKATKTAVREAVETLSGVHLSESTRGLKTDERMAFGVRMDPICVSPKNAIYIHTFPESAIDKFLNYVKYEIIEPMIMESDQDHT
jgi:hypothetical protein